jgi:hypothetical protein
MRTVIFLQLELSNTWILKILAISLTEHYKCYQTLISITSMNLIKAILIVQHIQLKDIIKTKLHKKLK